MAVFKTTAGKDPVKESTATYQAGDMIFSQGDLGTDMFIIQDGEVAIIKHINNGSRFDEMLRKNPEIAVRIIRKYSKRLREANLLLERLVGREVDADHAALDATRHTPGKTTRNRLVDMASGTAYFFSNG